MKVIHRSDALHTPRTRDAALRRLRLANRWLLAGSAVLTGVLTDVAANAFPGHAKRKSRTGHAHRSSSRAHAKPKPLAPPAAAPTPTITHEQAPPPVTEPRESPPTEEHAAPESTTPESAPTEEAQAPSAQQREALPPPEEPVVSGGS